MMKNYSLAAAALLAVFPSVAHAQAAPAAPAPITLRLKFTPGQTLYYSLVSDTNGTVLMGQSGAGMPLQVHTQVLMHQTVKNVRASDGAATLDVGIDSMSMGMNGKAFPMPADKLGQMKTLGTLLLLPTGKTLSFTPSAAMGAATPPMPGMDMSHMSPMSGLGQLPEAPIKAGDTWKSAIAMSMIGAQVAAGFTLTGVDTTGGKTVATIAQTTSGTFDTAAAADGATAPASAGMAMTGTVSGTGTLRFDVAAGTVAGQTSRTSITMTMTPPGATEPVDVRMNVRSTLARASAPAPTTDPAAQ